MHSAAFRYSLIVLVPALLLLVTQLRYLGETVAVAVTLPGWLLVEDLALGYSWSNTAWHVVSFVLVPWLFWAALVWAGFRFASRHYGAAAVVTLVLLVSVGYLAFRTTATEGFTLHRRWGFITHMTADVNGDGQIDREAWYTWSQPMLDVHSPAQRARTDNNFDGRWDTWIDNRTKKLRIDTDGDGVSDATLENDLEGYERARELRGF